VSPLPTSADRDIRLVAPCDADDDLAPGAPGRQVALRPGDVRQRQHAIDPRSEPAALDLLRQPLQIRAAGAHHVADDRTTGI
jgi:hypothetical protein